jgi:holo-[acyl-carrier protein] synthase
MDLKVSSRVLGIGIDLVEVSRIAGAIERQGEAFLRRIYTDREREYCVGKANAAEHFAARFAAKEAASKAFGTGIGEKIGFLDIEIVNRASGAPSIVFLGKARTLSDAHGVTEVLVSLSHTEHMAAATVVLQ